MRQAPKLAIVGLALAAFAGCFGATGPAAPGPAPIAVASVEIRTNEAANPDPNFHATCQTGAAVILKATGSSSPSGGMLTYEWSDVVDGYHTADLRPRTNPFRTTDVEVVSGFYTIGFHELTLTVSTPDGRKATTTLRIKVTTCEDCGGGG